MSSMTGQQIVDSIRLRADIVGFENRHTDTFLLDEFDRAMRNLRLRLFLRGSALAVATLEQAFAAAGASSGWPGQVLDLSNGAGREVIAIRSVRVKIDDDWVSLREVPESEVTMWDSLTTGSPQAYATVGSATASTTLQLCILPVPDATYTFQVTYLPEWPTTGLATNVLVDVPDAVEASIWAVCEIVGLRDKEPDRAQGFGVMRLQAEQRLLESASRIGNRAPRRRLPVGTFFGRYRH